MFLTENLRRSHEIAGMSLLIYSPNTLTPESISGLSEMKRGETEYVT